MTASPALTIAIPTLNRSRLVGRAIESAIAQDHADIEIIVSDNGSTDDTATTLSRFRDPRLRIVRHEQTMSPTSHGNFLVAQAKGELFVGLSDDDWLEPEFARSAIELYAGHPEIRFAYSGAFIHYGDVAVPSLVGPEVESGVDFLRACFAQRREVCWCASISRTADLREDPLPEGRIFGDMYYWTRLAQCGPVGCIRSHLSHYVAYRRDHRNVVTVSPVLQWAGEARLLADEVSAGLAAKVTERDLQTFEQSARRYVARSTANQFMWNALRGADRLGLATSAVQGRRYLNEVSNMVVWLRVLGGILAPSWLIERRMIAAARRMAGQRPTHRVEAKVGSANGL